MIRIGHGYDVHRFVNGRRLVLGGVEVLHDVGLEGHSDADVLTHAIIDALLGSAALGDIGAMFPDTDPAHKDADSIDLLRKVLLRLGDHNYTVINIDSTIVAQKPKLAGHIMDMRNRLSQALGIEIDQVSIKATTTEGLGFAGREEGMAAYAVALLEKIE